VRALDPWPHSEAGRFHRGIALVLVALAVVVCVVELVRHHAPPDILVAGGVLGLSAILGARMSEVFRATPSGFPWEEVNRRTTRLGSADPHR
jgi:ABC-type amino acid transport system permease subunit